MFGAVTFNVRVQDAPGSMVTPERLMLGVVGVATATPPHVLTSPFGLVTRNPPGSTSVNPTFVIWIVLGFSKVNVSATTPPGKTDLVAKAFVRIGGLLFGGPTLRVAEPGSPVPPLVEVGVVVLTLSPTVVAVTVTVIVQVVFTAKVAPARLTAPEPGFAVTIPEHVVLRPLGDATLSPTGKLSLKATPNRATVFPIGFVRRIVRLELPFSRIELNTKSFVNAGGRISFTISVAVDGSPVPALVDVTVTVLTLSPIIVANTSIVIMQLAL